MVFDRIAEKQITGSASRGKVKLLFGARQTGKSTILRKIKKDGDIFINLQDRTERLLYEKDPAVLLKRLDAEEGRRRVLIDEIQKVPVLLEDVQLYHDKNPGRFDFILSGSSARKLHQLSSGLIPGRAHRYRIFPVLMDEMDAASDKKKTEILLVHAKLEKKFPQKTIEELLIYGALPGIMLEPGISAAKTLESYAEMYLEDEIRKEGLIKNMGPFSGFLELAALESGNMMNLSGISQQAGIAVSTLSTYYQVLVDTFIGFWLRPFISSPRKRILKTPKFYFFDTGVRNALAKLPFRKDLLKLEAGRLFENRVAAELYYRCGYAGREYQLFYWKAVSGAEVDIVLKTPSEVIPIEVKWTDSPDKKDARSLETFLDLYGKIARRGYVICRAPFRMKLTRRVTALPWNEL